MRMLTTWAVLGASAMLGAVPDAVAQDDSGPRPDLRQLFDADVLDVARFESLATSTDFPVEALVGLLSEVREGEAGERRRTRILRALRIAGPHAAPALAALLGELRTGDPQERPALAETLAVLAPYAADPRATVRAVVAALLENPGAPPRSGTAVLGVYRAITRAQLGVLSFDRAVELLGAEGDVLASEFGAESLAAHGLAGVAQLREATARQHHGAVRIQTEMFVGSFRTVVGQDLVAGAAARALAQVDPDAREATPGLVAMLRADLPSARRRAAMALGRHGADAVGAVQPLLIATRDPDDPDLVAEAVTALGMIGERDVPVLERLDALATHSDRSIAARARAARRALEPR